MIVFAPVAFLAAPAQASPPTPPSGQAPPVVVTGPAPDDAAAAAKLAAQMHDMYQVTCAAREFGAYDDVCNQLDQQVKEADRVAARKAREAARMKSAASGRK